MESNKSCLWLRVHSSREQLKSIVTKVAQSCTDQCFAQSRVTLHDHGKLFIEHNILGKLQ